MPSGSSQSLRLQEDVLDREVHADGERRRGADDPDAPLSEMALDHRSFLDAKVGVVEGDAALKTLDEHVARPGLLEGTKFLDGLDRRLSAVLLGGAAGHVAGAVLVGKEDQGLFALGGQAQGAGHHDAPGRAFRRARKRFGPLIVGVVGLVVELSPIQNPPAQLHGALEMLEEPGAQPAREQVVVPEDGRETDELQRQLRQAQARQEDLQVRPAFPVGEHLNLVGDHQPDSLEGARLSVENLLHLLIDHHRDLELLFLDGLVVLAVVAGRDHHPRPAGPIAVAEGLELLRGQGLEGHEIHGLTFLADDVGHGHLADEGLP